MSKTAQTVRVKTQLTVTCLSGLLLCIAVLCYGITSFGWFSMHGQADYHGINIEMASDDVILSSIQCFPVTEIEGGSYTFDDTKSIYELPMEDPADLIIGKYKKAIVIRIGCSISPNVTVSLSAYGSADWISNTQMQDTETPGVKQNYLSNCVQFTRVNVTGNTAVANGSTMTFVSGALSGSPTKIALNMGEYSYPDDSIYFVMEYNPALMEHFCTDVNVTYASVNYYNDITFEFS